MISRAEGKWIMCWDVFLHEQESELSSKLERAEEMIKSFCLAGIQLTMNQFNNK